MGVAVEWGPLLPKDGGHGDLGIGMLLPRDAVLDWKETNDHYLAVSRAKSGEPVSYYIGAGWTDSGDFRDVRDWWTISIRPRSATRRRVAITFVNGTRSASR